MSRPAGDWARKVSGLRPRERMVLINLADHVNADDRDRCWPSVPLIAAEEGLGERTVQRALRGLERRQLIRPERPGGGRWVTTVYVLAIPENPVNMTGFRSPIPRQSVQETPSICPQNPVNLAPESVIEPVKNRARRPATAARGGRAGAPQAPAVAAETDPVGRAEAARAQERARASTCPRCDEYGVITNDDGTVSRCDHRPEPRPRRHP